jgi:membrane protein
MRQLVYPFGVNFFRTAGRLIRQTVNAFSANGGPLLAAGLSFYALLSIGPLLLVVLAVASFVLDHALANSQTDLYGHITGLMEPDAARIAASLLEGLRSSQQGTEAGFLGTVLLLWSATRLLKQLQDALHQLWNVRMTNVSVGTTVWATVRQQGQVVGMLLIIGALVVVSVISGSASAVLRGALGSVLPGSELWWSAMTVGSTIGSLTLLFALLLRILPAVTVPWREAFVGAFVTALMFAALQYPLSYYLGSQGVPGLFGATGSLVMFLLWVYWAAQVFFLGAQFTLVWTYQRRRRLKPSTDGAFAAVVPPEVRPPQPPETARASSSSSSGSRV